MRGAVHYKGEKTVEIRIFKGIVSYATVVKNIEFVDSVVEFTRTANTNQVTLKHYLNWVSSLPSNKWILQLMKQITSQSYSLGYSSTGI